MDLQDQSPAHAGSIIVSELGYVELSPKFYDIVLFLNLNQEYAPMPNGKKLPFGSIDHLNFMATKFVNSRKPLSKPRSTTIPDSMVSFILEKYFEIDSSELARISKEHTMSMLAENMIGDLLERYIAHVLEPIGWIWASGSTIKAVDFILPPAAPEKSWYPLQVKNRQNTENSSSSAIRKGTIIQKWFRSFPKRAETNWEDLHKKVGDSSLSEVGFRLFVENALTNLKEIDGGLKPVSN
jgi:hypothetical protein